ncbi:MAG: hypothetical protein L0Y73_09725 [Candidatus Aminicenantes bacterium]|nr:hypothetical protein [Candidatus Aminicenantes bacterium]
MKKAIFLIFIVFPGVLILVLSPVKPLYGIVWCHDYTYYRASGQDPSPVEAPGAGISAAALRGYLEANGYKRFPYTNAAQMPGAGKRLKTGDVVIIDDAHSGYVTGSDMIDHFIQVFGSSGKKYTVENLPKAPIPGKVGGLYTGDSLTQFIDRRFKKTFDSMEVWRKQ